MTRGVALTLGLLAAGSVFAATQGLPSSPKINIVVTRDGQPLKGARVTFHREIENGETDVWTGLTGLDGSVSPPDLPEGKYRIFADGGKRTGGLFVEVKKSNSPSSRFEIGIAADDEPYLLQWIPESAGMAQFRGTIQDEMGGLISRVNIRIFRRGAVEKDEIAHAQSDERGAFSIKLDPGKYEAAFEGRGFKRSAMAFEVDKQGLKALRLTMQVDDKGNYSGVGAVGSSPAQTHRQF